jgi:hypothetical protein
VMCYNHGAPSWIHDVHLLRRGPSPRTHNRNIFAVAGPVAAVAFRPLGFAAMVAGFQSGSRSASRWNTRPD